MPFDVKKTCDDLIAMRVKLGADTPKGHACSNLIEQLQNYERLTALDGDPFTTSAERENLQKSIREQMARLTSR